jgi:Ser/Thr protein kinase RdoA (MazF antagonist)
MRKTENHIAMKSDGVKAHGLDGQLVRPDWPALRLEEVDQLLRRFPDARKALRILSYSPRPFSAASVVETPAGKVFVKRHHRLVRDKLSLHEEHHWMSYLSERCKLVKRPFQDAAGETAVVSDDWTYEVHPHGDGIDLYEQAQSWTPFLSVGHARNAGLALAKLHQASAGYHVPARHPAPLVTSFGVFSNEDPWPVLTRYVEQRPALRAYLGERDWLAESQQAYRPLHDNLRRFLPTFGPLWTQNDFHASNLLWSNATSEAEVTDIFDFGLADRTTALHDVATAIERNGVEWLRIQDKSCDPYYLEQIEALLSGYEQLRPFSRTEAEALVALLPVVHAEFALSEADYFTAVLNDPGKADLAYVGYFLGHARWFSTEPGKRLLDQLENWASRHTNNIASRESLAGEATT